MGLLRQPQSRLALAVQPQAEQGRMILPQPGYRQPFTVKMPRKGLRAAHDPAAAGIGAKGREIAREIAIVAHRCSREARYPRQARKRGPR